MCLQRIFCCSTFTSQNPMSMSCLILFWYKPNNDVLTISNFLLIVNIEAGEAIASAGRGSVILNVTGDGGNWSGSGLH